MKTDEIRAILDRIFEEFPNIHTGDIPGIDLYMDQVTTFLQENLRGLSRDPDGDKFLTKTMINNYVKNKVLIPPVKKKYSRDHIMLLIIIYYMKSFLSINDIRAITGPVMDRYADIEIPDRKKDQADKKHEPRDKKARPADKAAARTADKPSNRLRIRDIYEDLIGTIEETLPEIHREISGQIDRAEKDFADLPEQERTLLQQFSLINRLSAEVYIRKLLIEKLLDMDTE